MLQECKVGARFCYGRIGDFGLELGSINNINGFYGVC
jgi:hypothetical protein